MIGCESISPDIRRSRNWTRTSAQRDRRRERLIQEKIDYRQSTDGERDVFRRRRVAYGVITIQSWPKGER